MTNEYQAIVESCGTKSSYAWLTVDRSRLAARRWPGIAPGQKLRVRIRPEDVILSRTPPGQISARNVFPGHTRSVRTAPDGTHVTLDLGFTLTALISPEAARELGIRRGVPLFAIMKATAVVPIIGIRTHARISFVGERGLVDAGKMDFLRTLAHTGSLSAGARELGISYRTAWMWARAINRAWGFPLIHRIHGGRGGGGVSLTSEGRTLIERARKLEESANRELPRTH
jgi:molybdate transport system regulatory protein